MELSLGSMVAFGPLDPGIRSRYGHGKRYVFGRVGTAPIQSGDNHKKPIWGRLVLPMGQGARFCGSGEGMNRGQVHWDKKNRIESGNAIYVRDLLLKL